MDKPVEILIAEDNQADVVLLSEALESTGWNCRLHVARDGEETLAFLGLSKDHPDTPRPDLILLDRNLPLRTGLEILREIRLSPALSLIPLIILSGAKLDPVMAMAFGLPEERYLVKPKTFSGYVETAKTIEGIWRKATSEAPLATV